MSQRLEKYAAFLKRLHKANNKERKQILKKVKHDKEFVKCLCECAKNIIKGNIKMTAAQREKICRRKQSFRKLALKKTSLKEKQRIVQSGGFLGALLGPIISVLGSLFGSSSSS